MKRSLPPGASTPARCSVACCAFAWTPTDNAANAASEHAARRALRRKARSKEGMENPEWTSGADVGRLGIVPAHRLRFNAKEARACVRSQKKGPGIAGAEDAAR